MKEEVFCSFSYVSMVRYGKMSRKQFVDVTEDSLKVQGQFAFVFQILSCMQFSFWKFKWIAVRLNSAST